jgi:hypothetical protein
MAPGTNSGGGNGVNQVEGNESTLLASKVQNHCMDETVIT